MKFSHYSAEPICHQIESVQQSDFQPDFKPRGFWISVDGEDDWKEWCTSENYAIERLSVRHEVWLYDNHNILLIENVEKFDAFSNEFGEELVPGKSFDFISINWQRVADKYQGLIVAPYRWDRRYHRSANWYSPWDCASGCIWDVSAIKKVEIKSIIVDLANGDEK